MIKCPKCSSKMKRVVRFVALDEDLGGGRIARSEKRIERMVCRRCGYVQMTGDAIANSAWVNDGTLIDGGKSWDPLVIYLIVISSCAGVFISWGLFRTIDLWWKIFLMPIAGLVFGLSKMFLASVSPVVSLPTLFLLLASVWWWPLAGLAVGWKIVLSVIALLISIIAGGLMERFDN